MKDKYIYRWFAAIAVFIPVLLSSCGWRASGRHDIIGMELKCDSLLMYRDREYTVASDEIFGDASVILWIDSAMCTPCEMERLFNYESLSRNCENVAGPEGRLKVIISLSENIGFGWLINEVKYLNLPFDMFIDYKNRFPAMLKGNERLLIVLKDGRVRDYFRMENTDADIYRLEKCISAFKELYD